MKKIALLFTILCVGALNGMETEHIVKLPLELHKAIVQTALEASSTVDQTIKAIQNASAIHSGVKLNNAEAMNLLQKTLPNNLTQAIDKVKNLQGTEPKDFTKLVHLLAKKFNISPYQVASLFNTPIAQKYIKLSEKLEPYVSHIRDYGVNVEINNLISQGADVNFYNSHKYNYSPLLNLAIGYTSSKSDILRVKQLINAGANPFLKDYESNTALDKVLSLIKFWEKEWEQRRNPGAKEHIENLKTIQPLIEEAMKNYQQ